MKTTLDLKSLKERTKKAIEYFNSGGYESVAN